MMAKNFNELADRAKAAWSDDTRRVYEAAASEFTAEVNERAELGALLATARKARSLTQPALSELTGIQQAEISRIERGAGNPTAATLLRLADALGHKLTLVPANR
jgi:DNA-binding phage protein